MEPTGIEPVTSCLQRARESGRLRIGSGCLRVAPEFQPRSAGGCGSDPGVCGFHKASRREGEQRRWALAGVDACRCRGLLPKRSDWPGVPSASCATVLRVVLIKLNLRPTRCGSSMRRIVSTSGSSGISGDRLEHDRPRRWRILAELVRSEHLSLGLPGRLVRAGVDVGDRLAFRDRVAVLLQAADPDGVVKTTAGAARASARRARGAGSLERLSSGPSRSSSSSGARRTSSHLFLSAPVLRSRDRFRDPPGSDPASRNAAQLAEPAVPPTVDGLVPHSRGGFR